MPNVSMSTLKKTAFISYRRHASLHFARLLFTELRLRGYDAFIDVAGVDNGTFERVILEEVGRRAHFLMIIAPGSMEGCSSPYDWLRREFAVAVRTQRNIVPVLDHLEMNQVPDKHYFHGLVELNAIRYISDYHDEFFEKLEGRFLKSPTYFLPAADPEAAKSVAQIVDDAAETGAPSKTELEAEAWVKLATEQWQSKDYEAALEACGRALALDSSYAPAHSRRGTVLEDQGNMAEAIEAYSQSIALNPRYAMAYNNRASAYADLGEPAQAVDDFTQAILLDPMDPFSYAGRGNAHALQGRQDLAIADYDHAVALHPQYPDAYYNRGNALLFLKRNYEAIQDYDQAIALNPQFSYAYAGRGLAHHRQGDWEKALRDFDEAIEINPQLALTYHFRGNAYAQCGNYSQARADFLMALELDPTDTLAKDHLAKLDQY